jgi:peptidoglycan/LPS O-acetylase OafA/YrhL
MDLQTLHETDESAALEMQALDASSSGKAQTAFVKTHGASDHTLLTRIHSFFRSSTASASDELRPTAWLDCLRGIAAILVVFHHWNGHFVEINAAYMAIPVATYKTPSGESEHTPYSAFFRLPGFKIFLGSGATMVCIFFLVGGWVLTQSSLQQIHSQHLLLVKSAASDMEAGDSSEGTQQALDRHRAKMLVNLSSATVRRGIRLHLPVAIHGFIGMILVMLRLRTDDAYFYNPDDGNVFWHLWQWFKNTVSLLNPFIYRVDMTDLGHRYEWVLWTIPLEFYGSLVCFIMTLFLARITSARKRRIVLAIMAMWAMLVGSWWSSNFLTGMLLADLTLTHYPPFSSGKSRSPSRRASLLGKVVFAIGLYFASAPFRVHDWYTNPGYEWLFQILLPDTVPRYTQTIGALLILICFAYSPTWQARLTRFSAVRWAGRCSFSLYLLHIQLYDALGVFVREFLVGRFKPPVRLLGAGFDLSLSEPEPNDWLGETPRLAFGWLCFMLIMWPVLIVLADLHARYVDKAVIRIAHWAEAKLTKPEQ